MMGISILCGGKNSRMGEEKGLLLWQKKRFIDHILEAVEPFSTEIHLIHNGINFSDLPYPIIKDIYVEKGPLGGIHSALVHSTFEKNLILSCDMPLVTKEYIAYFLSEVNENNQISVAQTNKKIHPLCGIYSKSVLKELQKRIKDNDLKLINFILARDSQQIEITPKYASCLSNINSKEDLIDLKKRYEY